MKIVEYTNEHKAWATSCLTRHWGEPMAISRGNVHQADELPGFIALRNRKPSGLVTYHISGDQCEIVTLNSDVERKGIGSALIEAVKSAAMSAESKRLWLITTNDNVEAIRFYQKRGFELVAVYRNAIERYRRLKPSIPLIGNHGIPIRDEIEFEIKLRMKTSDQDET